MAKVLLIGPPFSGKTTFMKKCYVWKDHFFPGSKYISNVWSYLNLSILLPQIPAYEFQESYVRTCSVEYVCNRLKTVKQQQQVAL